MGYNKTRTLCELCNDDGETNQLCKPCKSVVDKARLERLESVRRDFGVTFKADPWPPEFDKAIEGINPKDLIGAKKVDISLIPTAGVIMAADCMGDGAKKYGPFNWREKGKPVQCMTYLSAAMRHILAYIDGEDKASDSGKHHIAHAVAGLMVLLDAQACDNAIDNRPIKGATAKLLQELQK